VRCADDPAAQPHDPTASGPQQERIAARSTAGVFVVAGSLIVVGVVVHVRIGI